MQIIAKYSSHINIINSVELINKLICTVFRKLEKDEMRECGINTPANIYWARDRPAVNSAGPRNVRIEISISMELPAWPVQVEIRQRKGLETGQPEVVDVRCIPTQVIIVLRSHTAQQDITAPAIPVMLSCLQILVSKLATL